MASCCGNKQSSMEYEVTYLADGTKEVFKTWAAAKMAANSSTKGGTVRAVAKAK